MLLKIWQEKAKFYLENAKIEFAIVPRFLSKGNTSTFIIFAEEVQFYCLLFPFFYYLFKMKSVFRKRRKLQLISL